MPKSHRIRTQVGIDKAIKVNLQQDFESINILSLKILQSDIYNRQCSDYGVIVGRVFVNGGFGLPNARVSIFIPLSDEDATNPVITELYPYQSISDVSEDGYRYNLLPKDPSYDGHVATGTFPNREEVLLDQSYIEVYDKYYKYTTKTNESGDYMIFGVPLGTQTVFMDCDLSDIGCFSLVPQDLIQAGMATEEQVDGNKFKSSTNLAELPQIKTLNKIIEIAPLWGEPEVCQLGITRVDFDLTAEANIKIEPKAIFMGSVISTTDDDSQKISCKPRNNTGNLCELIAGPGQILSIRQTINNDALGQPILEEYKLEQGGKVIDEDGAYLVNLPMNLDYVYTNEFGETAISTDPKIGIPTKGKYRFKFKWNNEGGLQNETQRANFFVPNIKEYGWTGSDYNNDDPLKNGNVSQYNFIVPAGGTSTVITIPTSGGLVYDNIINATNFSISINGLPYYGDIQVIPINAGDQVEITPNFIDVTQQAEVLFNFYNQEYFDLLRSYSFSLDWDDYVNPSAAINCEDTFYEFHYNKVYTTAMFLDRYKKGIGRGRHLGIKEIDNRSCKSTVNTFPVNDVVRNFDWIFFIFNLLMSILAIPILVILFIAHLIALLWPILKWLLIVLGLYFVVQAAYNVYETATEIAAIFNEIAGIFSSGAGVVFNITNVLEAIRLSLKVIILAIKAVFLLGLSVAFTYFAFVVANRIKGFPRIGLPMISYPDCSTCDCNCGEAELSDDFDESSTSNLINELGEENSDSSNINNYVPTNKSNQVSFLAPINNIAAYFADHPNIDQPLSTDPPDPSDDEPLRCLGNFWYDGYGSNCGGGIPDRADKDSQYRSFANQSANQTIGDGQIAIGAQLGFNRLASGSESLDTENLKYGIPSKYCLHAPQPYLFAPYRRAENDNAVGEKDNQRFLSHPISEAYSQKLNEFNFRQKYFDNVNKIKTTFNSPQNVTSHYDQPLVILAKPGTLQNLGVGTLLTFQDTTLSNCNINITGATFVSGNTNQFGNNAVTATTQAVKTITVQYANTQSTNSSTTYTITGGTDDYLHYPIDVEYFQIITGYTYSQFTTSPTYNLSNYKHFPNKYLNHKTIYVYAWGDDTFFGGDSDFFLNNLTNSGVLQYKGIGITGQTDSNTFSKTNTITKLDNYQNFEILILTRGVDPHSPKQRNKYDLSILFGQTLANDSVVVEGDYYLNIPIKGYNNPGTTNGIIPISHSLTTTNNTIGNNLYFEPYNFQISPSFTDGINTYNEFQNFQSTLPYYYSSLGEDPNYVPCLNPPPPNVTQFSSGNLYEIAGSDGAGFPWRDRVLPCNVLSPASYSQQFIRDSFTFGSDPYYFAGGSFTASNLDNNRRLRGIVGTTDDEENNYWSQSLDWRRFFVFAPAYYKYGYGPVQFSVNQTVGSPQYLVMRSDRIPTSTCTEEGPAFQSGTNFTSYGLHQNNKFCVYKADNPGAQTIGFEPDPNSGQGQYDESENVQSLTSTLTCEGMVSLQCYTGSGTNVGISSNCVVPPNRVKQGCYCLLNYEESDNALFKKLYLVDGDGDGVSAYRRDARLFLEWKTRFTITFAACRGVFAQVFQNNWINGVLYMFSFNKSTTYDLQQPDEPKYNYCQDTIVFNDITKGFYYRSSPWDGSNFIGVDSPPKTGVPNYLRDIYPGFGYNDQRIQFPTTVMDMGPRDSFINQICNDANLDGYIADQLRSTSYKDNSDIIQMGFISRLLNERFRQRILPISTGGNDSEGKGIIQFFNSDREGERIDGDFAQALSINSEWNVTPYIEENYPNNYLFIGDEGPSEYRSVFGVFFSSSTEEFRYRRRLTPGIETYTSACGPVLNFYGHSSDQIVPHYKWQITTSTNIFGSEDNNWVTTANLNSTGNGFYSQYYQNLDFDNANEYYQTSTTSFGIITNFDLAGNPQVSPSNVITGQPSSNPIDSPIVVGAPFFFYFGLNNGKTAMDRFAKLYLETE